MDSRTQLLYKAGELGALGYGSGVITAIGFNVHSNNPQVMNGFQIKMKNTTTTALSGTFETGTTFAYSGTYAVSGTGWQMITLQTPFSWNGSNLLIEICFDNSSYTLNTTVTASSVPSLAQHYMEDLQSASGCAMTNCFLESFRPDITLTFSSPVPATCAPLVVDHLAGNVAPVYKTGNYSTITYLPGEPTKCWITRNLGASQQPAAVNDTAEASAGWYWQFNRKQGFKHDGVTRTPGTNWIISLMKIRIGWPQTIPVICCLDPHGAFQPPPNGTTWIMQVTGQTGTVHGSQG